MLERKSIDKYKKIQASLVGIYLNLVVLGLPLIINNGYYNITETKSFYFVVLSLLLVVSAFINTLTKLAKEKRLIFQYIPLDLPMLLFGMLCVLSAVLSTYQLDVWIGEKSRYQGTVIILVYVIVYFIVSRNYFFSQNFLLCLVFAFSVVSFLAVLNCFDIDFLGFYNILSAENKSKYVSTIGNVNFYSSYMCLIFPVLVCGYCQTEKRSSKLIYTFALIIGSFGMMVTSSESFAVGFAVSMLIIPLLFNDVERIKKYCVAILLILLSTQVYSLIYRFTDNKNVEISQLLNIFVSPVVSGAFILLVGVSLLLLYKKPECLGIFKKIYTSFIVFIVSLVILSFVLSNTIGLGALDKVFKISEDWGTYRGGIWKQLVKLYSDFSDKEKLFGVGPEALHNISYPLEAHGNKNLDQAHNEYLQYLLTTGIFGILSYISVIVTVLISVIKKLKSNFTTSEIWKI